MIQHLYQELFGDNQGSVGLSMAHLYGNQHVRYLQTAKLFIFPMLGFLGTFSIYHSRDFIEKHCGKIKTVAICFQVDYGIKIKMTELGI